MAIAVSSAGEALPRQPMDRLREEEATARSERYAAELEDLDVEATLAEHRKNERPVRAASGST